MSGDGPPLLLIHGAEASRHMFDAITPLLAQRFTVIAYDQRDCGDTEAPARPATLAQLALDAKTLVRSLGLPRVNVFGSSFGGRIAQVLAASHGDVVDRLVLGSTWALPHSLAELNPEGSRAIAALRAGLPHTSHQLAAMFFPDSYLARKPALLDFFGQVQPSSERSVRRAQAVTSGADIRLADIAAPTLLLAGDSDRVVPAHLTFDMGLWIANARRQLLPGVGHATCLQAPAEVAQALTRFIEDMS
ncbi:alpha/beta fold hydrolase [Variovorax sp. GB1R11]|uniref:alpha/beta fold hydrolase n=1 Tax=Variovorax sp. GB1R11 TaxID=3443741 RepID=UPI003F480546